MEDEINSIASLDEYKSLKQKTINQIENIKLQITKLANSSLSCPEKAKNILELRKEAYLLFKRAKRERKIELLKIVSSNRIVKDKILSYNYNSLFEKARIMNVEQKKKHV